MPSMASPRSPSMSTRRFGDFVDARAPQPHPVKRWDGAARTCAEWDNLRRDPELWYRNGDCLVHLYAKGQSRRGPSFKVTFSDLLAANCIPLIERSISREGIETIPIRDLPKWTRRSCRRVELYIPPPTNADKTQAFNYHLATRNFFAWVYRRSMVGQTLGEALVGVMHSMNEFRSGVDDNVEDLMGYLDEEGYLNMANQPNHALAMLHLAECFQMKELYIRAFTHAVGMNDALLSSTEYQQMTSKSRKAVRKARLGLNRRLIKSSTMLRTLLDDELSEAHLAIPSGARAHLERFRSFLMSFYTTKFGYFPPQAVDSCCDIFEASVYRTMREDFEALYHLLVDEQYTTSQPMPLSAHGGICTLQLVQSFDKRNRFDPLDHPLPLIPELAGGRRMSLFSKRDKLKPDRRLSAHAALARASNPFKLGLSQNDLVRAYRRFEEDSVVSPNRADKQDKVSLIEARKVRWILVYTIYQVLRSATDVPPEVEQDVEETKYNLAVSTTDIPSWTGSRAFVHLLRRQTDFAKHGSSMQDDDDPASAHIEIKPDIDYFALAHREESRGRPESRRIFSAPNSRSNSLKRALSRSSTIRRSMRMFKSPSHNSAENSPPKRRATYHEILVQGYGNGTNVAKAEEEKIEREPQMEREPEADFSAWAGWEDPWVEPSSEGGSWTPESMESNYDTSDDSPLEMPSPTTCFPEEMPRPLNIKPRGQRRRDVYSMVTRSLSATPVSRRRPVSGLFSDGDKYAEDYEDIVKEQRLSIFGSLSRASSRRSAILPELKRRSHMHGHKVSLQIEEQENMEEPYIMPDDADWQAMEAFMESERLQIEMVDHKAMPEWEYADLGGLTEVR